MAKLTFFTDFVLCHSNLGYQLKVVVNSFSRSCSEIVNKLQFLERVYTQKFENNVEDDEALERKTFFKRFDDHNIKIIH